MCFFPFDSNSSSPSADPGAEDTPRHSCRISLVESSAPRVLGAQHSLCTLPADSIEEPLALQVWPRLIAPLTKSAAVLHHCPCSASHWLLEQTQGEGQSISVGDGRGWLMAVGVGLCKAGTGIFISESLSGEAGRTGSGVEVGAS